MRSLIEIKVHKQHNASDAIRCPDSNIDYGRNRFLYWSLFGNFSQGVDRY